MPTVYLSKDAYDEIIKRREDVTKFVEEAVKNKLNLAKIMAVRRLKDPTQ